eukprot:TRINITY_DN9287_c0_g1_i1.p1 TRINITY_DN9287_c0_g1~~TRINITY_DN9287_c0_g1_i1.p1  ORF type:complete len:197 (-),score=33.77 TRINITY_DN9287_c0_g1_i1:56-646(-)
MPKVHILCTGFGEFPGVTDNPSSAVASASPAALACVAPVSISGVECALARIFEHACGVPSDDRVVVIHFGVNSGSGVFALEQCAWNEKSFSRPDVSGSQPQNEAIDKEKTLDSCLKTTIEVEKILDILSKKWNTIVSQDPGRYICNYTFYRSLQECKKHSHVQSIFCHVPNPELVPVEKQKEFACDLIHAITSIYQ